MIMTPSVTPWGNGFSKRAAIIGRQYLLVVILILSGFSFAPALADDSAVVLMYHRFGEDRYPETSIKVDQFEAQLSLLEKEAFSVIALADLLAALTDKKPLPPNAVVITIDDAYQSIYEIAYPRLKQHGFPFTVFVATDPVDDGLPAYLNWSQMRLMAENGASFANHGASHLSMITRLEGESDNAHISRALADVEKGHRRLAEELNPVPNAFAYPYGEYNSAVAERLQAAGYICFGQQSGAVGPGSDRRALPRFPIAEEYADIGEFRIKVKSLPMPVEMVKPWDPVVFSTRPEVEITLGKADVRFGELSCFIGGQGRVRVRWIEKGKRFAVVPPRDLGMGRQRVNCTVPMDGGRYLWFSHPWFVNTVKPK